MGDAITALGFRLAGMRVTSPRQDEVEPVFQEALEQFQLVFITAEYAESISEAALTRALSATLPLTVVVADARNHVVPPDLAARLRREIGIEA